MKFEKLRHYLASYPIFSTLDVRKWFPEERAEALKVLLSLWVKKGRLKKIRRDLFWFSEVAIQDHFFLADKLIHHSYISLESALNYYSIIPDVPFSVTCVTQLTTRVFETPLGRFSFRHTKKEHVFGWKTVESADRIFFYRIASPEKALVDFVYFNLTRFVDVVDFTEERFSFGQDFRWRKVNEFAKIFNHQRLLAVMKRLYRFYEHTSV